MDFTFPPALLLDEVGDAADDAVVVVVVVAGAAPDTPASLP